MSQNNVVTEDVNITGGYIFPTQMQTGCLFCLFWWSSITRPRKSIVMKRAIILAVPYQNECHVTKSPFQTNCIITPTMHQH